MTLTVHIEKLILTDIELETHQHGELKEAVESALKQQLMENGTNIRTTPSFSSHRALESSIQITDNISPSNLGQQIAKSVYGGIS